MPPWCWSVMRTKGGSGNGKHRVLGSIAYVGACRANHFFVADPHDPIGRRVLMLDNGGNVAAPAKTLAYRHRGPWQRPRGRVVGRTGGDYDRGSAQTEAALIPRSESKRAGVSSATAGFVLFWPKESSRRSRSSMPATPPAFPRTRSGGPSAGSARSPREKALAPTVNGVGDLAPTHSPVDPVQRWQRWHRLQARGVSNSRDIPAIFVRGAPGS